MYSMELTLSWDLFIVFFFSVVTAYSFIIGKHQTLTILVAVYIAILATQGLGNIFVRFSGESDPVYKIFQVMGVTLNLNTLSITKLLIFMLAIIGVAIKGGLSVECSKHHSSFVELVATCCFGLSTAALIILAMLTFVAGAPLADPTLGSQAILVPLMESSMLVQAMVMNQNLWFALPALLLIGFGLTGRGEE